MINSMEIKECEHHYEAVKQKIQEWKNNYLSDNYLSNNTYDSSTLNQERVYLFCRKCWDNFLINGKRD